MEIATTSSTLSSIFHQRCPRCRLGGIFRGSIFRGFPKVQERCPVCDLKFAREAGYFIGAMYISYGIALLTITLIAALLWAVTGWWITKDVIWAVILFLPFPLSHFLPVFCGSIWIRRLIRRHADLNLARRITDLLRFTAAGYPVTYVQKYRDFELALFAAGAVPSCCSHGHAPWLAFCAH